MPQLAPPSPLFLRAPNSIEGHLLKGALEQEEIPVILAGGQAAVGLGELQTDALCADLYVPADYLERAREVYACRG